MLLFVLPSLFLLVHTTPSPLLRTPTVSEAPQKGRYFVSSAPRPTDLNDAQLRRANYLDIISPNRFFKSLRATGGTQGAATSPYNSPADYFAERRAYSAYAPAAPLYAPHAMTAPVPTVTSYAPAPPSYQQTLAAPALPASLAPAAVAAVPTITYAAQPNQSAVYNVVAQPVAAAAAPVATYAPAPVVAPVVAAAPPPAVPVYIRPAPVAAAPVAAPVSQLYYRPAAPAPVFAAPPTPAAAPSYSQPFYAPRAMTVPLPTVTVAAPPPTVIPAAPPASMPVFDFVSSAQPRSPIYPSNIIVPPAPLPAAPAARPIYAPPTLLQPASVPASPIYIHGDSSSAVKNPFQISYLPQPSAAAQTVQPTVPAAAAAAPPSTMMTVTLSRPSLSYLQIQNGQHGRR